VHFTTASDAHRNDRVADRAAALATLLAGVGVEELSSYVGRSRVAVPLDAALARRGDP
jgi:hypothetical protein